MHVPAILHMAWNDVKLTARNRVTLALLIILPVFMVFLMSYAMQPFFEMEQGIAKFPVHFVNEDDGPVGRTLDDFLRTKAGNIVEIAGADDTAALTIRVPRDLSARIDQGAAGGIEVIGSGKNPIQESVARWLMEAFVDTANTQIALTRTSQRLTGGPPQESWTSPVSGNYVALKTAPSVPAQKLTPLQYFSASMLVFFLLTTGMGVGTNIIKERLGKLYLRISSFPVTKGEYLAGKIVGNAWIAALQAASIVLVTQYIFGVNWGQDLVGLTLTVVAVTIISVAVSVIFAGVLNSAKALTSVLAVIFWFMTFMSGGFVALPALESVGEFTVNKWAFSSLSKIMVGENFAQIRGDLLILFGIGLVLWITAITIYNRRASHE